MPISYTDENAQDAVGNILTNTSSVNFSYNDNLNTISAVVVDSGVNHNLLSNYVANEHVNHTGVLINAGTGLTGGGDISSSRTISIADTTVSSGNYGSSNQVGTFSVNSQGQLTAAANVSITPSSIGALGSLNGLTDSTQTFGTGTAGTDFGIVSSGSSHTFNLPDASATGRGVVTTGTQTMAGDKTFTGVVRITGGIQNIPTLRLADGNVYGMWHTSNGWTFSDGTNIPVRLSAAGLHVVSPAIFGSGQDGAIGWGNTYSSTMVTQWREDAPNVIGQRNGTNTQVYRVYNTFTNSSNLERLALQFVTYSSARYAQLACESAGTGIANMNLVLSPKGTGALIAGPMPDGTAIGGNARGANAIDIQTSRTAATQVASAADSICIGKNNTSTSIAGISGISIGFTCNSQSGVAIGNNCSSTYAGFACGEGASVVSQDGTAIGRAVSAGQSAMAIGTFCSATTASQATGDQAVADRRGMRARATGRFAAQGDRQSVDFILANRTTDGTTSVTLFLDGSSIRLTIPSGKILFATMQLVGSKSDGTAVATYMRKFAIKNLGGTTTLVGAVETIGTDVTAGTSFSITADNTNDAINPSVIGINGETWRWVAVVYGVELAYGT